MKYFEDFTPLEDTFEGNIYEGKMVRSKESGDKIFLISKGFKHWVTSPDVLKELGFSFGQEEAIDRKILQQFRSGEPINVENVSKFKASSDTISPVQIGEVVEEEAEVITIPAHEEEKFPHVIHEGLTSIIIPVYLNSYQMLHLTGDCIGQIREHTGKLKTPYEIIIILNGGEIKINKSFTHADKVIENEKNLGFAKAVNQGIRVSQGEFIAIVNNDVKVYEHWLEDMLEGLQHKDLIMATPMYSREDPWMRGVESRELREEQIKLPIEESFSEFEDFSCVAMKRLVLDTIGLFDEKFFYSCEDVDFLRRMKEGGFTYASSKRVRTHHVSSATDLPDKAQILDESKAIFKEKWEKDSVS